MSYMYDLLHVVSMYHRSDVSCYIRDVTRFTLQYIHPDDMPWLRNEQAEKSMILSGFHFTLLGNSVNPCDISVFSGPFITYIRESDSYQSLIERLVRITGDQSISLCRIAAVDHTNVPAFLPRPIANVTAANGTDESKSLSLSRTNTVEGSKSLWEIFATKFPHFVSQSFESVRLTMTRVTRGKGPALAAFQLPQIGIQRSSADLQAQMSLR